MSFTIGQCITGSNFSTSLSAKFGGRQNLTSTADGSLAVSAICEAISNLSETFEFEELKYATPIPPATTLAMTTNVPQIPIATILATAATNAAFPQFATANLLDITDVYTFWMWFSGGVNQAGRALKYRRVTTIDNYSYGITSAVQGQIGTAPPTYYTRFGNVLQVSPAPDQAYSYFVRVKLRHPFPAITLAAAPVFLPDSWQQAVQYLACYNLALGEGASQYIDFFAARLLALGVDVKVLKLRSQMERDELHNERALSFRQNPYTSAG